MVRYLLAVDQSAFAENAFYAAVSMMIDSGSQDNELIIFSAAKRSQLGTYGAWGLGATAIAGVNTQALIETENERSLALARGIVASYLKRAHEAGIKARGLCGLCDHVGELICDVAESRDCAFIIIGRSGMGKVKRFFLGSVSDYVLKHAHAHVILIKGTPSPAIESEMSLDDVRALEEQARSEKIHDEVEQKKLDERSSFLRSALDLHITAMAEESERARRIKAEGGVEEHGGSSIRAAVVAAEEAERAERIAEDAAADAAERAASNSSLAFTKQAEEAERRRRLASDPPVSALGMAVNDYLLQVQLVNRGLQVPQ